MNRALVVRGISYFFIILFLYTSINKIVDHSSVKEAIEAVPLLRPISTLVAILLPFSEIIASICLFFDGTRRIGLRVSLILSLIFSAYVAYVLSLQTSVPCSCGGVISMLSWNAHLFLNLLLVALATIAIYLSRGTMFKHGTIVEESPDFR